MGEQEPESEPEPEPEPELDPTPAPTAAPTTAPSFCSQVWGQCGGMFWHGYTCCEPGNYCEFSNPWYSQCKPESEAVVGAGKNSTSDNLVSFASLTSRLQWLTTVGIALTIIKAFS